MALSCLNTLVGVSKKTCTCVDSAAGLSYDPAASDVGLWLDQLINIKLQNEIQCGDPDNLWVRAKNALNQADDFIQAELNQEITKRYTQRKLFAGVVGGKLQDSATAPATTNKGVMLTTKQTKGGYLTIDSIDIRTGATENVTITIDDRHGTTHYSATTAVTANQFNNVTIGVTLPLWWDEGSDEEQRYFIYHDSANTYMTGYSCGCGVDAWSDYFSVEGIHANTPGDIEAWTRNGKAHGMVINSKVSCPLEDTICDLQSQKLTSLGFAKWYRAAIILGEYFLESTNINQFTLYKGEDLADKMLLWESKYNENIEYLSKVIIPGDCYTCHAGVVKASMIA